MRLLFTCFYSESVLLEGSFFRRSRVNGSPIFSVEKYRDEKDNGESLDVELEGQETSKGRCRKDKVV